MVKLKQSVIAKQNNWIPYAAHKVITDTQGQVVQRRLVQEKLIIQEVQALPDTPRQATDTEEKQQLEDGVSVCASIPDPSTRLARFYARRDTQHQQVLEQHREWQTQDDNHRQENIQSICTNNTEHTQTLQQQIQTFLQTGSDSGYLVSLSTEQYAQREQTMQQLMAKRREALVQLEQRLLSVEEDRLSAHQAQLLRLVPTLINIAHLLPDAIHDTLQPSVDAVNQHVVKNQQSIRQLIHKLTAELEVQEQSDIPAFTQQTQQWRQVRHKHTIETFQTLLNDPDYTQPTNRQEQVKQLRSLHENCLSASHSLLEALLTFHVRYLTRAKIETIQKEIERRVERLRMHRDKIIKRINKIEEYRVARLSAELQAVQTACDGYAAGTVEEREAEIQLECREPMQISHAAVLSFIQQTQVASEAHINQWMKQLHNILHFFSQAAHLHLKYTQSLQTQQETLHADLQQLQSRHQQDLASLESLLQEAVSKMKQSESMEALEIHKQQVWEIVADEQEGRIGRAYHEYPQKSSAVLLAADQSLQQLSISACQQMATLLGLQSEQDKQKQEQLKEEEKRKQQVLEEEQRRNEEKQEAGKKKGTSSSVAAASAATASKTKTKKTDKEKEEEEKKQKLVEEESARQKQEAEAATQKLQAQRCIYTLLSDITHTEASGGSSSTTITSDSPAENQAEPSAATVFSSVAEDQRVFYKLASDAELLEQLCAGSYLHVDMRSNEEKQQAEREAHQQEKLNQQRQLQEVETAQQAAALLDAKRQEEEAKTKTATKGKQSKSRTTPVSSPRAADSRKKQKDLEKEEKVKLEKENEQQAQQQMAQLALEAERQRVLAAEQTALNISVDTNGTAAMVPFVLNEAVILSLLIKARESWMMLIASLHSHVTRERRQHRHLLLSEQMKELEIQTRQLRPRWNQLYSPIYHQRQAQLHQHTQQLAAYIKQQEQQQQQQFAANDTAYQGIEKQALLFEQYVQERMTALQQVKSMTELYAVNQQVEKAKSKLEQEAVQPLMRLSTELDSVMKTTTLSHAAYLQRLQNACFSPSTSTTTFAMATHATYHSAEITLYQQHLEEQQKLLVAEMENKKQRLLVLKDKIAALLSVSAYEALRQSVTVEVGVQHGLGNYGAPKRRLVTTAHSVYAQHHSDAQEAQTIIQQLQAFHQQHIHPDSSNGAVESKSDPQLPLKCLNYLDSLRLCLYRRAAALQCLKANLPWSTQATLNTPLAFTAEAAAAAPISARFASVSAAVLPNPSPPTSARNKAKSSSVTSRSPASKKIKEDKSAAETAAATAIDQGAEDQHMMVIIQQAIQLCREETKAVMKNYMAVQAEQKKKLLAAAESELSSARPGSKKGKKEDSTGAAATAASSTKASKKKEVVEVEEIVLPVWLESFCQQEWAKAMSLRQTSINLLMEQMLQTQSIVRDMIATIFLSTLQHLQQQTLAQQQPLQQGYTLIHEAFTTELQHHHLQLKPALVYQSATVLQQLIAAEQQRRSRWYEKTNEYYQRERELAEKQAGIFVRELHHATQCLCRLSEGWLLPCDLSTDSKDDVWSTSSIMDGSTSSASQDSDATTSKKKGEKEKNGKKPRDSKTVSSPRGAARVSSLSPLSVSHLTVEEQQRWNRIEWPGIKFTEMKWSGSLPLFLRVHQPQSLATAEENKTAITTNDGKSLTPRQGQKDKSSAAQSKKVNPEDKKLKPTTKAKTLDPTQTSNKSKGSSTNGVEAINGLSPRRLLADADSTVVLSTLNLPFIPVIFESRDSAYQQYLQHFQQHHKYVLQRLEKYAESETVAAAKWEQQLKHLLQQ